jgi:SAM-dependent methyltransferase
MSRKRRPLIVRFAQPLWAMCNDAALNIHTTPPAEPAASTQLTGRTAGQEGDVRPRHDDSARYEVPDYLYLRRVVRALKPGPEDVIFDLGCGMGRFLCLMARRKVRKCVGVELLPQLCEAARKNSAQLRGRRAPIEIRCGDAATADPSEGTIYYLFNPFGPATMSEVLANIRGTLSRNPRNITIVYYNSVHEELFENSGWLEKYHAFRVQSGMAVTFWRSRQGANPPQPHKT